MKKLLSAMFFALLFCITLSFTPFAIASENIPDVFFNDFAPPTYDKGDNHSITDHSPHSLDLSNFNSRTFSLDRHNALIAAGYELVDIQVIEIPNDLEVLINTNGVVVESTKVVTSTYKQPRQSKVSYNNKLLDGVVNYGSTISTIISSAVPKAKWIPKVFGFVSKAVVEASANSKSTFEAVSSLHYYDIQCKITGWSSYFTCASSEMEEVSMTAMFNGYRENGTTFGVGGSGYGESKSAHYQDNAWLTTKAKACALSNDGSRYYESAPEITSIKINKN